MSFLAMVAFILSGCLDKDEHGEHCDDWDCEDDWDEEECDEDALEEVEEESEEVEEELGCA